ncbi:non-ribosomal peptide synthetase, partial [Methanobrevibacter sp.]|uniref:non-ribosomal peptide synthetase n=1 Tax=Methanobrevibacter sp. TaxID=66852 RepID=UPI00386AF39B
MDGEQLFKFKIYETPDETVLFANFHHLITDGIAQDNLFNEIMDVYGGKELPEEQVDGYVYSLIEEKLVSSEKYELSRKFFHDKLSQEIDSTVLTPDLNGNPDDGNINIVFESMGTDSIKEFCQSNAISQNSLMMACTVLSLNKFTYSDNTLITSIFNGRAYPYYQNTQAFLVKTLPIIISNENRNISLNEFIGFVDKVWKDSINHIEYPYTRISEDFQLKPEFFYTYQENEGSDQVTVNDKTIAVEELSTDDISVAEYKINLNITDTGEELGLVLQYNDQLYSKNYAQTFLKSIICVLNQFIEGNIDETKICDVSLVDESKSLEFKPVEVDNPILHRRIEQQVKANPDDIALVACDVTLTYGELNQKANRIANALIKEGVEPKNNILVMLHRNSDLIASILGILKVGCAFIPIDLEYPQERIDYIYENSQADYIISDEDNNKSLNVKRLLDEFDDSNPDVVVSPDDLAYMIYTSGSTGKPKGVMISHENICNEMSNPKSEYDSVLCLATISFDAAVEDILTPLSNGLKLVLADDNQVKNVPDLIELLKKEKPETSDITPSRLASYLEVPEFCDAISCLKGLFIGGEQFSRSVYEKFRRYSDAKIYNIYGPTETTITSNIKEITDINDITVGPPLHNYVTDVRDIDGKLVPNGVMGELYIGGMGVGKGYYNMPEKTKEVFITINGIPYYRSGDYAIEMPNGEVAIQGRIDDQIKLRGLRIEIGEIESNISRYPGIKQN